MNDAKPTCGWNESKPYSNSDHEYAVDLHGIRRMQEEIDFRNRSEGTEPITAKWLIDKWGGEDAVLCEAVFVRQNFNVVRVGYNGHVSLIGFYSDAIKNQPKTRDEFRSFARWFGLEEKK